MIPKHRARRTRSPSPASSAARRPCPHGRRRRARARAPRGRGGKARRRGDGSPRSRTRARSRSTRSIRSCGRCTWARVAPLFSLRRARTRHRRAIDAVRPDVLFFRFERHDCYASSRGSGAPVIAAESAPSVASARCGMTRSRAWTYPLLLTPLARETLHLRPFPRGCATHRARHAESGRAAGRRRRSPLSPPRAARGS